MTVKSFRVVFYYLPENGEEEQIGGFDCENYAEMIKLFKICKENEIEINIREDAEHFNQDVVKKLLCGTAYIDDFDVSVGDDTCMQLIRVFVR